jgi:hypothetical protein
MGGPLGKYSQQVAAIVAVGVIAAAVVMRVLQLPTDSFIDNMALIAMGAVFGAAASTAVNGHTIEAAHRRLDLIAAPPSGVIEAKPELQSLVTEKPENHE